MGQKTHNVGQSNFRKKKKNRTKEGTPCVVLATEKKVGEKTAMKISGEPKGFLAITRNETGEVTKGKKKKMLEHVAC